RGLDGWSSGDRVRLAGEERPPVLRRGTVREPAAISVLSDALADPHPCVRRAAAQWLGRSDAPEATGRPGSSTPGPPPLAREAAAFGLGVRGRGTGRTELLGLLGDHTPAVAAVAAWALGRSEDPRNTPALLGTLKHADPSVREASADALG